MGVEIEIETGLREVSAVEGKVQFFWCGWWYQRFGKDTR